MGSPPARYGLREVAKSVMQRHGAGIGETVNLGILNGTRVVNLHKVESRHLLRMPLEVRGGAPAHATAIRLRTMRPRRESR